VEKARAASSGFPGASLVVTVLRDFDPEGTASVEPCTPDREDKERPLLVELIVGS
jgi:hypothetical protein